MAGENQSSPSKGCHMSLQEVATVLGGKLMGNDAQFEGVSTDTRKLQPGQLFVALKGPNFDAHDFAEQAQQAGVTGMLVEKELSFQTPHIVVADSLRALGQLASCWREKLNIPTLAITGSNGKTTVKEMSASILAQSHAVFATIGNLNNDIGVPLTLLSMDESHECAVVEMGANHAGEIAYLTQLTQPNVALLNNAAPAHLEGFGTVEGVAKAKGEIFQGLKESGIAVFNADDTYAYIWVKLTSGLKTMTFGLEKQADVSCEWTGDVKGSHLKMTTPAGSFECQLNLAGKHNVMNALAATAATLACGVSLQDIKSGLEALQPVSGRLQLISGKSGSTIINDTYNANPNSLQAGLDVLAKSGGQKYLALGDMGELGEGSDKLHFEAGLNAKKSGVDMLFALGDLSREAVAAFGEGALHFSSVDALVEKLQSMMSRGATVLVKGSRSMRMERVVDALAAQATSEADNTITNTTTTNSG